jgi:non-heme chloroperoxidase
VRAHGEDAIAGINYVAGALMLNENLDNIGPGFVRGCTAEPMSEEEWETTLCFNIVVPRKCGER